MQRQPLKGFLGYEEPATEEWKPSSDFQALLKKEFKKAEPAPEPAPVKPPEAPAPFLVFDDIPDFKQIEQRIMAHTMKEEAIRMSRAFSSEASRAGEPWTLEEEHDMERKYLQKVPIAEIARYHKRTAVAIQMRLEKLGLKQEEPDPRKRRRRCVICGKWNCQAFDARFEEY